MTIMSKIWTAKQKVDYKHILNRRTDFLVTITELLRFLGCTFLFQKSLPNIDRQSKKKVVC